MTEDNRKDYVGQTLKKGDRVVHTSSSHQKTICFIDSFTPKMVRLTTRLNKFAPESESNRAVRVVESYSLIRVPQEGEVK